MPVTCAWARLTGQANEVVIEVDEIVIFRYPAPSPQTLQDREREDAAAEL
jgi:hypothetical protein